MTQNGFQSPSKSAKKYADLETWKRFLKYPDYAIGGREEEEDDDDHDDGKRGQELGNNKRRRRKKFYISESG